MKLSSILVPLFLTMAACDYQPGIVDIGEDGLEENSDLEIDGDREEEDREEEPDYSEFDDATLQIVSPQSGDFLPLEELNDFEVALLNADGDDLDFEDVSWSSNEDNAWSHIALAFADDTLAPGLHNLTAQTKLPNGDRLSYTVGGIRVQSYYSGTYAGLFSNSVTVDTYTVPCSGNAVLVVDPSGKTVTGDSACVLGFQGFEVEATYLFDLENVDGVLTGTASMDIGGFFQVPYPAEGSIDLGDESATITFAGEMMGMGAFEASVSTERITLDTSY